MIEIVKKFGRSLDLDDFETAASLLAADCIYEIGAETLIGPDEICNSYRVNMIEGRKKLDKLEWGESWVEAVEQQSYVVHFTDYLEHRGVSHVHRCRQQVKLNKAGKICRIEHLLDEAEASKLKAFYTEVGLD